MNERTRLVKSVKSDEITEGDNGEDRTVGVIPVFSEKEERS